MDHRIPLIVIVLQVVTFSSTDKVILQRKPTEDQKWDDWIVSPQGGVGWQGSFGGSNPLYMGCAVSGQQPNTWLRSNAITVEKEVKKVDITILFNTRSCTILKAANFCVEYFDLYVHQSGNSTVPDPSINNATYEKIAEVTAPILGVETRVTKTFGVEVKGKYIVLAFRNQGSCSAIRSVIVSYSVCPEFTVNRGLVSFPQFMSPANNSKPVQGNCVPNTVYNQGNLSMECQSDGDWNISSLKGRCICREDKENSGGKCKDCIPEKYNDMSGLNCTVLPSTPRNVHTTFVNQSALGLQWESPEVIGDHTQVWYDVNCRKPCNSDDESTCDVDNDCGSDVIFIPSKEKLSTSQLIVGNLSSFINYTFKIYARNRVSEVAKSKHGKEGFFETITVRTNGSVPGIPELSIEQPKTTVVVSWTLKKKNGVIKEYDVTYINANDTSDTMSYQTKTTEMQFDLKEGKTYQFKVFAINDHGRGPAGTETFTLRNDNSKKLQLIAYIAGGAGALLLIILIVVIIVCFVSRRRRSKKSVEEAYMKALQQGSELQPTNLRDQRTYIDPNDHMDLQELLTSFATERKRNDIKLEGVIGTGEFADVYKGTLKSHEGKGVVAVKVLRPGSSEKSQKDFLSEASLMGQFDHPNVIHLIGVVTQSRPMMILTEFLESGSLDHFLKERKGQLTSLQLVGMARGVAHGMKYLSDLNFIHRDLAARNVLVGENMLCKVSDFGLSRELADDDEAQAEYTTQGGKIPVRWTAPEALQHRTFSSASDVWSFGILMWEIMSYCDRPYWNWDNFDVIKRVETGYRLPAPQGCPKIVHNLMIECWHKDKTQRPNFSDIVNRLDELIRSPEFLNGDSSSFSERCGQGRRNENRETESNIRVYDDVSMGSVAERQKVDEFTLDRDQITTVKVLGSGNFGQVSKAVYKPSKSEVAVKSLKVNAKKKDLQDMLTELDLMKTMRPHPHVVKLIGCCIEKDPPLIVLEYLPYGDLLGYLRKSRGIEDPYNTGEKRPSSALKEKDLLSFAWMIADGMSYLSTMKIVHRDLAARNVLVGNNKVCKISDLGLARGLEGDIYTRKSQARLPAKWMPPESLLYGKSTTMSDIWSYGIVMWEVFTIGESPYPGVKSREVAGLLQTGYRMPKPPHISQELYSIMTNCWEEQPKSRPTFPWLCSAIKRLLDDLKTYVNLEVYEGHDYINFDVTDKE